MPFRLSAADPTIPGPAASDPTCEPGHDLIFPVTDLRHASRGSVFNGFDRLSNVNWFTFGRKFQLKRHRPIEPACARRANPISSDCRKYNSSSCEKDRRESIDRSKR